MRKTGFILCGFQLFRDVLEIHRLQYGYPWKHKTSPSCPFALLNFRIYLLKEEIAMKKILCICLCLLLSLAALTGCGREAAAPSAPADSVPSSPPELPRPSTGEPAGAASAPESAPAFSYKPGDLGSYVMAPAGLEAGSEALDSIPLELPEELTLEKVSNCQYDFVLDGRQVAGLLLLDLPEELLENAGKSPDEFLVFADYLGRQVMPDAYPETVHVSGGGRVLNSDLNGAYIMVNYEGFWTHKIYRGETYCYDFWMDRGYAPYDPSVILESIAAAEDIRPERNNVEFDWYMENLPKQEREDFQKKADAIY